MSGGRGALFYAALGYAYGLTGRRDEADEMLESLRTSGRETSSFYEAMVHAGAGRRDEAIASLTTAVDDRFNWVVWLHTEPMFSPLHDDARFEALTRRIGLPKVSSPQTL